MEGLMMPPRKKMKLDDASDSSDDLHHKNDDLHHKKDDLHHLPYDIIYSIFLKLPNKTLVRFLVLSKEWNVTLRSRNFNKQRKKTCPELFRTNIFTVRYTRRTRKFRLYTHRLWGSHCQHQYAVELSIPVRLWICSSTSDGLLGIVQKQKDVVLGSYVYSFVMWNPYTGQRREVPLPRPYGKYQYSRETCCVRFGYDVTIDDYKVVLIFRGKVVDYTCTEIFRIMIRALRSSDEQWRTVYCASSHSCNLKPFSWRYLSESVALDGAVAVDGDVWWIAENDVREPACKSKSLMKLSLAEEKVSIVSWPPEKGVCWNWETCYLSHDEESLHLIVSGKRYSDTHIWKFIKQGNKTTWEMAHRISDPDSIMYPRIHPIGFTSNGTFMVRPYEWDWKSVYAIVPGEESFFKLELDEQIYTQRGGYIENSKTCFEHLLAMETLISP